ncbi:MAG: ATP-binding protein [Gemmatimonadaceae bacterium]
MTKPEVGSRYRSAASTPFRVELPARWLSLGQFEDILRGNRLVAHARAGGAVVFTFPARAAVPAGVGLWLLSFLNQLAAVGTGLIHLEFATPEGLFSYLDRNGFLQLLSARITTSPPRPAISGADSHRGQASGLVEIAPLIPGVTGGERQRIVGQVVDSLVNFYPSNDEQTRRLRNHVFTVLGELVDNVFSHSRTTLPGFVCLQAYHRSRAPRIQVGVSDSGIGIPASIRGIRDQRAARRSDAELVIQAFNQGLSRHGAHAGRGCGLPQCAALAARYESTLFVRTPNARIVLHPATIQRPVHNAEIDNSVGSLRGTHIYIEFRTK